MAWKIIKKGSKAIYSGKKVKIEEILLNKAFVCQKGDGKRWNKNCQVVLVNKLKNITPKPK